MLNDSGTVLVECTLVIALPSCAFLGGMSALGAATSAAYPYVTGEPLDYAERNGN